jgi:hypothetical protein
VHHVVIEDATTRDIVVDLISNLNSLEASHYNYSASRGRAPTLIDSDFDGNLVMHWLIGLKLSMISDGHFVIVCPPVLFT